MPTELNLPSLTDLSEDPDERYSELEDHIRQLEGRLRHRADDLEHDIGKLRKQEEIVLKQEKVDYEYFGYEEPAQPRASPSNVVETIAGIVFLYGLDETSFDFLRMKMQDKFEAENDRILEKTNAMTGIGQRYVDFLDDFAARYANVAVIGEEDTDLAYALVHCLANNMVTYAHVEARDGYSMPIGEEEVTLEEYLSEEKQAELEAMHADCEHNQYIITHPSEVFEHDMLAIASGVIIQKRYFELNPDAKEQAELEEEINRAQSMRTIFGAIGEATRDPLGIGGQNDDDGMLN